MIYGFTGTADGGSPRQINAFIHWCDKRPAVTQWHHGDCIGCDKQTHHIVVRKFGNVVFVHPPTFDVKRAFVTHYAFMCEAKPYLERNHDIVNVSERMIAMPREFEMRLRSGTWATIRYARRLKRPLLIIQPDGTFVYENWKDSVLA